MGSNNPVRKVPELSNEVWAEVLSYLEYYDLKRCKRVSRQLKATIQLGQFDSVLFRSKPADFVFPVAVEEDPKSKEESSTEEDIGPERQPSIHGSVKGEQNSEEQYSSGEDDERSSLEEGECDSNEGPESDEDSSSECATEEDIHPDPTDICLHPAFDLITCMRRDKNPDIDDILNVYMLTKRDGGGVKDVLPLIITSAAVERATEPAVSAVYVSLHSVWKGGYVKVEKEEGVTVIGIMEAICDFSAEHGCFIQSKRLSFVGLSPSDELCNGILVLESFWTGCY